MIETPYGHVTVGDDSVSIEAVDDELREWAHRPGSSWPCSCLARMVHVRVIFNTNGIVELNEDFYDEDAHYDLTSDELNAWSSDVLRDVLPKDHPCYFITVGQFNQF